MIVRLAAPLALLLLAGAGPATALSGHAADLQLLIGPAFEQFAARTEALCPQARFRFVTPGDLDWEEEGFDSILSPSQRRRETGAIPRLADGTPARCAHSLGGLSCPTVATLDAIRTAGLIDEFARFACTHKVPGGG